MNQAQLTALRSLANTAEQTRSPNSPANASAKFTDPYAPCPHCTRCLPHERCTKHAAALVPVED